MEQVGTVLLHCPRLIICQVGECHAEGKKGGGTKTPDADMGQQDPSISGKCLYHWQDTVSYEMARDGKERKKLKSGVQSSTAGPPVCCKRGGRGEALHSTRRGWWWWWWCYNDKAPLWRISKATLPGLVLPGLALCRSCGGGGGEPSVFLGRLFPIRTSSAAPQALSKRG